MIDPFNLKPPIKGRRLQEWVLFAVAVAGRRATMVAQKLDQFLKNNCKLGRSPFNIVKALVANGSLREELERVKMGQYNKIERAFTGIMWITHNLNVDMLKTIHGIGPKTARMIMLYVDPTLEIVPLDTHVLKFMRLLGHDAPSSTPPAGSRYDELEKAFIEEARRRKITAAELDTLIWRTAASGESLKTLLEDSNA